MRLPPRSERLLTAGEIPASIGKRLSGSLASRTEGGDLLGHVPALAGEAARLERLHLELGREASAFLFEPLAILLRSDELEPQRLQALVRRPRSNAELGDARLDIGEQALFASQRVPGGRDGALEVAQLPRPREQRLLERRLAAAAHRPERVDPLAGRRDDGHGMARRPPQLERLVEVLGKQHLAEKRLGEGPVLRIDVDLVEKPAAGGNDHRRPPLRVARQDRGAPGEGIPQPGHRGKRRRGVWHDNVAEPGTERRSHRPLERRRHAEHAREQGRRARFAGEQAGRASLASLMAALKLTQRVGA